uniref:Exocyst complex component Sec8 n=1 Tax=Rhizophora mucronata TaxID=61149 RepID=A0A2P2LW81_RHIMU
MANGGDGNMKDIKIVHCQIATWLSNSTPDEFVEAIKKSDAPLHVKYLQTMVECLCRLGKVAAAGAIIWLVLWLNWVCGRHWHRDKFISFLVNLSLP